MEYIKLLYGDLVKFIVEFQNKNGRNIQYNNFLFEMGNWSTEPGFNPESNDQFSKVVNNNKKPVNAYYKYNDKIIHYLCSIADKDVAIFPVDMEKRNELMSEIVNKLFKSINRENSRYIKIEGYYASNNFENFIIAVFDFAHYNSVEFFNTKRKKNAKTPDTAIPSINVKLNFDDDTTLEKNIKNLCSNNEISQYTPGLITEEREITDSYEDVQVLPESTIDSSNKLSCSNKFGFIQPYNLEQESCYYILTKSEHENLEINNKGTELNDNSLRKYFASFVYKFYSTLNVKWKTVLSISYLIFGILIGVFLFSFINSNSYKSLAFPINSQKQFDPTQSSQLTYKASSVDNCPTAKSIKDSNKKISENKDEDVSEKQCNPTQSSQPTDKASSVDNCPTAKSIKDSEKKISENEGKDRKEQTNITIVGSGIFTIGDKNIVNVN